MNTGIGWNIGRAFIGVLADIGHIGVAGGMRTASSHGEPSRAKACEGVLAGSVATQMCRDIRQLGGKENCEHDQQTGLLSPHEAGNSRVSLRRRALKFFAAKNGSVKRRIAFSAAVMLAGAFVTGSVQAVQYPIRPIKLVVPWPAAGVTDIVARVISDKLQAELGQPVVVENKPGANGFIGTEYVAQAAADGYTLLLVTATTHAVAPNLYRKLPYDSVKDFAPVSQITAAPLIMVTPAKSPYMDVKQLIAAAKANPKKLNYATYGSGGSSQLAAALFMQAAGIEMTGVPYRGAAQAIVGLMSGDCDVFFDTIPSSLGHVRNGKLRALAVTSAKRVDAAPKIPTLAESFPGFEFSVWQGVEAPIGTPKAIIDRLHAAVAKIVSMPDVKAKFNGLGAMAVSSPSPQQFGDYIVHEKAKMKDLIQRAHIDYIK